MDEKNRDGTPELSQVAPFDMNWSEHVLVHRGSHSCFYKVYWKEKDLWLGLKEEECIDPQAVVRTIQTIKRLHSNFILHYYHAFVDGDKTVVLLTELMDYALKDLHRQDNRHHHRFTERQMKAVAFLTLHALADLHDRFCMVHGDVSPSNILLRLSGELKLGDLSSAMSVYAPVEYFSGTIFYTAIEVLKDRQLASSPSSDIWALGVTLYQCINGDHPVCKTSNDDFWSFLSAMEFAMKTKQQPMSLSHYSNNFHNFITSMLQWDPALRPTARSLLSHTWFSNFTIVDAQQELHLMTA
ncbi:protein kinase [Trypanosoma theileri]|uniref:Protein kinase n=1 Tax=Trypanosoma theileri TaxID=67003 RepID=A0A1X0P6Y5_9TRYP|nr:protein kinase [Trypanosoma theileri]ORC92349.1 protein kinase [Trypanosoma theileri]